MRILRAARVAALFLFCCSVASAQMVTLSAKEGDLIFEGRVLGYDGRYFRLETVYGEVTIDGDEVTCVGNGCPTSSENMIRVRISGTQSATSVLLPALVESFALRNGYAFARVTQDATHFSYALVDGETGASLIEIGFRVSSSGEGFVDLLVDEADLVASLRPIRPGEAQLEEEAGRGDLTQPGRARILALDAVVPVVSPESSLPAITFRELIDAYSDPKATRAVHSLARGSGAFELFVDRALSPEGLDPTDRIVFHQSVADLRAALTDDPDAIGLTALSEASGLRPVPLVSSCLMTYDTSPTSLKSGDYPLVAPVHLYSPARRLPPILQDFLAYLDSPAAQVVVQRARFVDQQPDLIPLAQQGARLAVAITQAGPEVPLLDLQTIIRDLAGYQRLSVTFLFDEDGDAFTTQSHEALKRLSKQINQGAFADRMILLTGHTASEGRFQDNRAKSIVLAEQVREALGVDREIALMGVGEALPRSCEDTALGRSQNQRVEVWIR
ncbi:MAG: phosphate ABC transporter substrate-binding/OmpA family protein [Pseudomonadota bacterium]